MITQSEDINNVTFTSSFNSKHGVPGSRQYGIKWYKRLKLLFKIADVSQVVTLTVSISNKIVLMNARFYVKVNCLQSIQYLTLILL